jgi:uncharacterized membrane protein YdjX (TVP38/TMEM64 family)
MNDWQEAIEQMQTAGAEIPPETLDQITTFLETSGPTVFSLGLIFVCLVCGAIFGTIGLIFVCLVCGAIFGTIGGLIGGSVFKVEPQAPVQEQAPPPPPPVG